MWANSKHDIYVMHHFAINHWSPLQNKVTQVINLSGQVRSFAFFVLQAKAIQPFSRRKRKIGLEHSEIKASKSSGRKAGMVTLKVA